MSPKLADLLERVIWTFIQAVAGSIAAAGAAEQMNVFDWRGVLIGGGVAAAVCAVKVLLGHALNAGAQPAVVDMARNVLLDLIDELFPHNTPEPAAVKAAPSSTPKVAQTLVGAVPVQVPAPAPVNVTVAPPAAPVVPLFTQPAATPPAAQPPSAAQLAALSAQQPTP